MFTNTQGISLLNMGQHVIQLFENLLVYVNLVVKIFDLIGVTQVRGDMFIMLFTVTGRQWRPATDCF